MTPSIITPNVFVRTTEPSPSSFSSSPLPSRKPFLSFSSLVSCLLCLAAGYHPAPSRPSSFHPYNLALWLASSSLPLSFSVAELEQNHSSSNEFRCSSG
ncbi:hypothetical protein HN51_047190 [Arachis hypogaea]